MHIWTGFSIKGLKPELDVNLPMVYAVNSGQDNIEQMWPYHSDHWLMVTIRLVVVLVFHFADLEKVVLSDDVEPFRVLEFYI